MLMSRLAPTGSAVPSPSQSPSPSPSASPRASKKIVSSAHSLNQSVPPQEPAAEPMDRNSVWCHKFQLVFESSTILFGFESFILSSYLNNYEVDSTFSDLLSWAILLIMLSLIANMFVSVLAAHMTSLLFYQTWHRLVLYITQWTCGLSLVTFLTAINLLVADSSALPNGFKIAIYTATGVCFLLVLIYYIITYLALGNSRVEAFLNGIACSGPLCG